MEKLRSSIVLVPGELVKDIYQTIQNTGFFGGSGEVGYLVLTNYRVLFYFKVGLIRKSFKLKKSVYFHEIEEISTGGRFSRHISINGIRYFPKGTNVRSLIGILDNLVRQTKGESFPSSVAIYCENCAYKNELDAKFCKNCGAELI